MLIPGQLQNFRYEFTCVNEQNPELHVVICHTSGYYTFSTAFVFDAFNLSIHRKSARFGL